jgi:hypothetical protein
MTATNSTTMLLAATQMTLQLVPNFYLVHIFNTPIPAASFQVQAVNIRCNKFSFDLAT